MKKLHELHAIVILSLLHSSTVQRTAKIQF